jgi:sugar phosphate isomerase/epimerase
LDGWWEKLKLSLSNGIFSKQTLADNVACVKQLGFDNLEFNMKCVKKEDEECVHTAKKLIDSHGLNCLTVHAATIHVQDEAEIATAIYYGRVSADFAYKLSSPVLVVHSYVSRRLPENVRGKFLARIFKELRRYAESLSVKLALENLSYASSGFGKSIAELEEILGIVDDGTMGVTLDFCHAEASGQTFSLLEKYGKKLLDVHLSNRAHKPFDAETPSLNAFVAKLQKCGYRGPLTIELNSKCTTEEVLRTKMIIQRSLSRSA